MIVLDGACWASGQKKRCVSRKRSSRKLIVSSKVEAPDGPRKAWARTTLEPVKTKATRAPRKARPLALQVP